MQKAGGSGFGGETYALKGDGALYAKPAVTQVLASGDTATIKFANNHVEVGANLPRLIDGVDTSASRFRIFQGNEAINKLGFVGNATVTLDGDAVTSGVTPFPIDGLEKTIVITATGAVDIGTFLANFNLLGSFGFMAISYFSTTTVARGTEGWLFDPTKGATTTKVFETLLGTGSDINLTGVAAGDFVTLPL
jgi:hypothetical protein